MTSNQFSKLSISLLLILLLVFSSFQIIVDPLFQYHKPWLGMKPVVTDERYQVAGMAKNFEFDNCIIGNSLCENFMASSFSNYYGNTIKLTISGSVAKDWTYVLGIVKSRSNPPKNIFFNIDPFTLEYSPNKTNTDIQEYLYNQSVLDDTNYILNSEIFSKFTINTIIKNLSNEDTDFVDPFIKNDTGKTKVMNRYIREEFAESYPDTVEYLDTVNKNIDLIKEYIISMPETTFNFFVSPFSILYWDKVIRNRKEKCWFDSYNTICERLLPFSNVNLYLWSDKEMLSMMSDLDNYIDAAHYGPEMCEELVRRMEKNMGLLSLNNYHTKIKTLFEYTLNYDYDSLFK